MLIHLKTVQSTSKIYINSNGNLQDGNGDGKKSMGRRMTMAIRAIGSRVVRKVISVDLTNELQSKLPNFVN